MTTIPSTLNHLSLPSRDASATAAFFERHLGFETSSFGTSRILKKDGLDIVIEHVTDRDVSWPTNFHIGVELASRDDVERLHAELVSHAVPMETDVFLHARGSRFFCWVPGGVMLEVNTRADAEPRFRATFASQRT
ncbi:extradiol dioxygenase [Roseateles aquatilis]|uniref:Extradiol dioxygenase n=1 Tax=Roseateles aquatilis TaxID=431061 RepID=A0A246JDR8_9BURK|nr:VOC family protein [Roseateles aquatilis]OWQ90795.1 extradiol dioxygenase [Roseateles aquatilis]